MAKPGCQAAGDQPLPSQVIQPDRSAILGQATQRIGHVMLLPGPLAAGKCGQELPSGSVLRDRASAGFSYGLVLASASRSDWRVAPVRSRASTLVRGLGPRLRPSCPLVPSLPRAISGEYIIQITAIGLFGLEFLDPEDDP